MIHINFKIGDFVTRKSHNHDVVFKIIDINNDNVILKGVNVRLYADSRADDLVIAKDVVFDDADCDIELNRSKYFYIPGSILHIDGDEEYLERSMSFYKKMNVKANGIYIKEDEMSIKVPKLVEEYHPDIVVVTGHDSISNKKYQNSNNFIDTVKNIRKIEKNQDKLIIIAGACQSNYEDLIKAGANFASSPKRVNIHALDPAIVATSLAFSNKNQSIDLIGVIDKTKFGSDGIGGIITNGTMYVGYPR